MRIAVAVVVSLFLFSLHCNREVQQSPETLYRTIERHFIEGQLALADHESQRDEVLIESSLVIDTALAARVRIQHAKIWLYQGHSAEALALLTPVLPANLANGPLGALRCSLLAIAYGRTGDVPRAQQILLAAEEQWHDELSRAGLGWAQGVVDGEAGTLGEAERSFDSSFAEARTSGDLFLQAQDLLNLAVVAARQEHYDDALDRFSQASDVAKAGGIGLALEKATGGAGWAYYKLGDYQHALANSQLAERQAAALGASIDQVEWLTNAGLSEFRLGDLNAAKASYEQSYQLARSLNNSEEIGDALLALAYLSLETGDLADAINKSREVQRMAAQTGNPDDALEPSLIEALALSRQGQTPAARLKLLTLERTTTAGESVRWETENALAKLAADAGDRRSAETWFQRAISTFRLQRSSLRTIDSRLPFFENGSSLYLDYMEQLIREGKTDAALAVLDQSRAETLAEGLGAAPSRNRPHPIENPQIVTARIHGAILVYCLRPHTSYLWAIGPRRTAFFRLAGQEVILPLVAGHTRAILSSQDVLSQQNPPGAALYRLLVQPANSLLPSNGKVFVIAGEGLNGLNFETLLTSSRQPHYWIEDANIIDARSLSLLGASHPARWSGPGAKRLLLVGDPIYNRPEYVKLPHASEEVASVAGHFSLDRRQVLTGAQATPTAYRRSHPGDFAYIHFVAHAIASEIDPLDSSVILSADNSESYHLYARDILTQPLDADLVTISACYGSGIRTYSGEGLVGLAWAFLHAGSHNVIGALWDVSDISTPQLMNDLYGGLAHGSTPDVALRSAKLAMIHSGGIFRKPFYWAPFQLYAGA